LLYGTELPSEYDSLFNIDPTNSAPPTFNFFSFGFCFFSVDLLDHLDTKQILYVACACVVFRPGQCLVLESIECVFVICRFGLMKQQLGVHGHL